MKLVAAILLVVPTSALGQSSPSYKLQENVLNAGGHPAQGVVATSPSFRLTLDAIGEALAGHALAGASYRLVDGSASGSRPPGEVGGVKVLEDRETLTWSWEPYSTTFNVYKASIPSLPGGAFGTCAASGLSQSAWMDAAVPARGTGFFYLITGENRLLEEGTKGISSGGAERANASPCP